MKDFIIYFELYGKKMKTTIPAQTEDQAKQILKDKIIFHKVQEKEKYNPVDDDWLNKFLDMLKK